ncbi:MAG: 4-hydroxy-tetrahydrodipicolinate reductase [Actinomycetota bacterium]|jgi:4-hydroxy-tetrahydrodipicolinate reductase|nr:4-hydroxy-tetrahydrodipicolinate reductase [Actinomycetota bacterium]
MGREICRAVQEAEDLTLAAAVDPAFARQVQQGAGSDAGTKAGSGAGSEAGRLDAASGLGSTVVSSGIDALVEAEVEVAVDFTVAEAARRTLPWLAERGIHAVVGTTGLGSEDIASAAEAFSHGRANAVIAPNFAIGAVLLMRLCELAAPLMDAAEIVELHHEDKRDAPSGTAMRTAARIAAARKSAGLPAVTDRTTELVVDGARGGAGPGGVRLHSVRLPGLVAHQEVIFGAPGQSLTLRHDSYDRRSFMPGVLLAVRRVVERPGLTVGLDALLGL